MKIRKILMAIKETLDIQFTDLLKKYYDTILVSNSKNFDPNLTSHYLERKVLCGLLSILKPKMIFEIGTYKGETTLAMQQTLPMSWIFTLDIKKDSGQLVRDLTRVTLIHGDSMKCNFDGFKDKFDFIFIDGNHHYKYVLSDSENAFKMVKKGGCIVWHDFIGYNINYSGCAKAILETCAKHKVKVHWIEGTRFAVTWVR